MRRNSRAFSKWIKLILFFFLVILLFFIGYKLTVLGYYNKIDKFFHNDFIRYFKILSNFLYVNFVAAYEIFLDIYNILYLILMDLYEFFNRIDVHNIWSNLYDFFNEIDIYKISLIIHRIFYEILSIIGIYLYETACIICMISDYISEISIEFFNMFILFYQKYIWSVISNFSLGQIISFTCLMYVLLHILAIYCSTEGNEYFIDFIIAQIILFIVYFFYYSEFIDVNNIMYSFLFLFIEILFFKYVQQIETKDQFVFFNMFIFSILFLILLISF